MSGTAEESDKAEAVSVPETVSGSVESQDKEHNSTSSSSDSTDVVGGKKRTIDEVDGSSENNSASVDQLKDAPTDSKPKTEATEDSPIRGNQGNNQENSQENKDDEDDEDDNDDDDNDDDDDEDEDVESYRKKQRRERNRFLDIEAEVSEDEDDEEDEEDSELVREGFITRGDEEDEEDRGGRVDDRLHRELDQNLQKTADEDMHKIAEDFKKRYGRDSSKDYRVQTQGGYVPQRFMLPSVDTAIIWSVRCRPGKEKELVRKLLNKKFNLDKSMGSKKLKILSIFQRDNYTGRIYIEAPKQSVIEKFVNGVPDVYSNQKLLIPVQELPLLLKPTKSDEVRLDVGSYVRIKRGIYKNDLAVIDQISQNNLEALLKIVPRLDYGKNDEIDPDTNQRKAKRATFASRPPPQLFNPTMALRLDQANLFKRDDRHFTYRKEDYVDGYLFKSFKIQYLDTKNIQPTVEELSRFGSKEGDVDLAAIAQTMKKAQASKAMFQPGDRVEVLTGEQRGSRGVVTRSSKNVISVKLSGFSDKSLEFPIASLRKIFELGDHVTVIAGEHEGNAGLVLLVQNGQVTFVSDQTRENLTISANNLSKSMDSTPTSSEYALHDIVELSAKNVACVIQAGHDIFKIIDDSGKVATVTKGSILAKINVARAKVAAVDGNGREIKIGDVVREKIGSRREGQVLYVQNQHIFIRSKTITENAGVFVVNPMNVEAVASKENLMSSALDLSKINPNIASKMGPPQTTQQTRLVGRDVALNKTVRIRSAGYKGQLGIVKDVNGDKATIELHSKNKHITIDKRKLTYFSHEGGEGITYDELVSRRGRTPHTRLGPSYVSAPRHMAAGGAVATNTPQQLPGGMTPGWNAFDGGKTPAVGQNGGTSSWGGASTWGGQGPGGASAWGGAAGNTSTWGGQGATSTWGGASTWGNKSSYGGASSWAASGESGAASAWGGGNKSSYGGTSTWGGNQGGVSAWGGSGNKSQRSKNTGGSSTWGNNQSQHNSGERSAWGNASQHNNSGNRSAWGNQDARGGGSTWGGNN